MIPTDDGKCDAGERLINFVWYYNVPDSSPEMTELLTDVNGTLHKNTVPRNLVNPAAWTRTRDAILPQMTPPVAELVSATRSPFATKVNDVLCASPSFHDGKVWLVGDAFATIRPHIAVATDQAALHAISSMQVLKGEKGLEEWCRAMSGRSRRLWLLSRVLGEFGQGTWGMFLKAAMAYLLFVIRLNIGRW